LTSSKAGHSRGQAVIMGFNLFLQICDTGSVELDPGRIPFIEGLFDKLARNAVD
jgi:hypothetical protein